MASNDFPQFDLLQIIEDFKRDGLVVVEIFSREEVDTIRQSFHQYLGIDHEQALMGDPATLQHLGGARIKSRASDTYAPLWKLKVVTDPRIIHVATALMEATFGPGHVEGFEHPLGTASDVRVFLDRAQYRLPDHVRAEGGLGLHLDRNPKDPYFLTAESKNARNKKGKIVSRLLKFRPIQSFISLTDQYGAESGGLRVVKGFHKEIDEYFSRCKEDLSSIKGGEFFRLDSKIHSSLWKRACPVDCPAGAIVFWDNRLPHATAEKLVSGDTREVLYTSYVPLNLVNHTYIQLQLQHIKSNLAPPAFNLDNKEKYQYDFELTSLTPLQQKMLGMFD